MAVRVEDAVMPGRRVDHSRLVGLVLGGMTVRAAARVVGLGEARASVVVKREKRRIEVRGRFHG